MSKVVKAVTLTPEQICHYRELLSKFESAEAAFNSFVRELKVAHAPLKKHYEFNMEILNDTGDDRSMTDLGTTHLLFTSKRDEE